MRLTELSTYLDRYLKVDEVGDYPTAINGLQVENTGEVTMVAAAVDAVQTTIDAAAEAGANFLLVHHGLFWDGSHPVTGRRYQRLRRLLEGDLAVYSAHLPLDVHPEVGNNVVLAREIGISVRGVLGEYRGTPIGVWGEVDLSRAELAARLQEKLGGAVRTIACGPERIRRVGLITGGAGDQVDTARALGLDAFITGEGAHHIYFAAEEGSINLFLGGHYATEVWGVQALARHLEEKFGLPWTFIDHPTGL